MNNDKVESLLIEAVSLAEEIMSHGSGKGRGVRLAAVILKLNESMINGYVPFSWTPPANEKELNTFRNIVFPKPGKLPTDLIPTVRPTKNRNPSDRVFTSEEVEYLNSKWDEINEND